MPVMAQPRPEVIASPKNPLLKEVRRAASRGELTSHGLCVAESFHLLEEALRSGCRIDTVLVAESARARVPTVAGARVITVADKAFAEVAATEASQGVIALVEPRRWTLDDVLRADSMAVLLDGIQDPGNAGAIVRCAEAFGASGAVLLKGTVSPFNPKTLRASAGSLFRLPFVAGLDGAAVKEVLKEKGLAWFAADPQGKFLLADADLTQPFALVIGAEGQGVSGVLMNGAQGLRIPTVQVESLNAATAAAVILYEASRQRGRP